MSLSSDNNSDNKIEDLFLFKMYEKAIEGRNFHYSSYNHWVNLYAIFTGAIFVGFYQTYNSNRIISVLCAVCGIAGTLCWLISVSGYYDWMKSWIKIVHKYEERLNEPLKKDERRYVFSVYLGKEEEKKHYSTQKTTRLFIKILLVAWHILFCYSLFKSFSCIQLFYFFYPCVFLIKLLVMTLFLVILICVERCIYRSEKFLSDIKKMAISINDKEGRMEK